MAMSSYLINSNYVDPKFPPCEEYSHSDYLPSHSPDYYGSPRPEAAAFQPDSLYHLHPPPPPPPPRGEPPYTPCRQQPAAAAAASVVVMSPRGHVLPAAAAPELRSGRCESVTPSPPPPGTTCDLTAHGGAAASPAKDPVVYPWMKKVHVNICKCCKLLLLLLLLPPPPLSPLSLSLSLSLSLAFVRPCSQLPVLALTPPGFSSLFPRYQQKRVALGSRFTTVCLQGQYNYTLHKFL
ncbi:Homeobox protein Hox-B4a [Liparis tanakae]|uniref:Homeobox protein Hox-B4a n=1 Tax=Liparis tanakae TaxID=230148 RepID=A0A4Z2E1Z4_9TELE|nr:Homeobox protein Hox-B4a [Liparis tanakae]